MLPPLEKEQRWPKQVVVNLLDNQGGSPLPTWVFSNGASTYESFEDDPSEDGPSSSSLILIVPQGQEQIMSLEARKGMRLLP